jgi:hypothetical protein
MLVLPFIRYFMTHHVRQRFLVHTGTAPECAMDLQDYGITTKHLPQNMGGDYHLNHFLGWLEQRQQLETEREEELFGMEDCDFDHPVGLDTEGDAIPGELTPIEGDPDSQEEFIS